MPFYVIVIQIDLLFVYLDSFDEEKHLSLKFEKFLYFHIKSNRIVPSDIQ